MSNVVVVVPTYNERENIQKIIECIHAEIDAEIVVVDDSSPDGTADVVRTLAEQGRALTLIQGPGKRGLAAAYVEGFRHALQRKADFVIQMDADFSHKPDYLRALLEEVQQYDLVVGSKYVSEARVDGVSRCRQAVSKYGNLYACFMLRLRDRRFTIRDATGGYNCWRSTALEKIDFEALRCTGYGFQIEMKWQAISNGASTKEIPIVFQDRVSGRSKFTPDIFWEALVLPFKLICS